MEHSLRKREEVSGNKREKELKQFIPAGRQHCGRLRALPANKWPVKSSSN